MKAIYFTPFPREVVNPVLDDTVVARPPIRGGQVNAKRRVEIYPANPSVEMGIYDSLVYCGNFIYSNQSLEQVLFDGGYMTLDCGEVSLSGSTNASSYYFDLKGYQGNVRMAVRLDTSSPFVTDYYPYKKEKSLCKKNGKRTETLFYNPNEKNI